MFFYALTVSQPLRLNVISHMRIPNCVLFIIIKPEFYIGIKWKKNLTKSKVG